MAFSDYSLTPGDNTSIGGNNVGENCSPATINNAIRQLAADGKALSDAIEALGTGGDVQPLDASLTAYAALVTAANKGIYFTAADAPATFDLTAFGRTLAGLADYAALRTGLGALTVTASSLANPGYIKLSNNLMLQWGTGTIGSNTTGTISYPQSFTTFAVCNVSGGPTATGNEGDVHNNAAAGLSSQAITHSGTGTSFYSWFAIGV
jgi:hypothetical protein